MADSFFGFDTSLVDSSLEDVLDCPFEDDDLGEEEEYDALNDETFGSEATIGDWEQDHEKLAEIAESTRPQAQHPVTQKNGVDKDIEDSLSHLIFDDKKRPTPHSNVWDNINLPKLPKPQSLSPIPLKNVCTVEELERGLIANRPPPGLCKPHQTQQKSQQQPQHSQHKPDGSFLFENLNLNEKFPINNGLLPPRFPPPGLGVPTLVVPPNMRLPPPPQFVQHHRLLPNQPGNLLRYPLPPHLMIPPGTQRQPLRGAFCGNFPPPPHPAMGSSLFLRPDHPLMPSFSNSQTNQQSHNFAHTGNQRNLNRPFHHNEQPGNHQPFFKNNQYPQHHNRNNQRNYYHQQNHFQTVNGSADYDEYAGLMSAREKQWLINIQLLQLNTNQPYVDDYYYTVFCNRQNRQNRNRDQRDRNQRNHNGNHRDSRDKDQPHLISKVVYTPTQFENSLGKLQCGSVTAPRKIIDMDVVPNSDPQSTSLSQQKDTKKTRQLLLEIERLYNIQLELEDLSNPLASLTNQQPQEGENEKIPVKKTAPELISMMLVSFSQLIQDDKLTGILSIRKGKTLLLRFLPHVTLPQYSKHLLEIWKNIFLGLNIIGRRDSHLLVNLFAEFQNWIESITDFETIIQLITKFSTPSTISSKNNSLAFAITNKFGVSVIASILEQGATLFPTENHKKSIPVWSNFISSLIEVIGDSHPCVAPCRPIAANTLNQHLKRMSSIKVEDYAVLELFLTDVNPSSNT